MKLNERILHAIEKGISNALNEYFFDDNYNNILSNAIHIEGPGVKTWDKDGLSISLKTDEFKYFVLLESKKKDYDWIIHFENESSKPYTDKEKEILFNSVSDIIKSGEIVTTEGGVTPGGISAIKKLCMHGFEKIGEKKGKLVYWASNRILDRDKWNEWIKTASPNDFVILDKQFTYKDRLFLSPENTRPVVLIIKKL